MGKFFIQRQLGLFFKNNFQEKPEKASLLIQEKFNEKPLFSKIIGIPDTAPDELPRITINFPSVNVNLSKNRIDFFSKHEFFKEDDQNKIFDIVQGLAVEIGRIGVVSTYFKETEIEEIKSFFNPSTISGLNPTEITVRFNEKIKINNISSNNSQLYTFGTIKEGNNSEKNGIIITRDINSLREDIGKNNFDKDSFKEFVIEAIKKSNETLV
jgi:hypothetical protein